MKKLTQEELNKILDQHKIWVDADEEEGERANFTNMDVRKLDFSGWDLRWAIFLEANCCMANFTKADCSFVNFTKADCQYANFSKADCYEANFTKAYCYEANFSEANCMRANFTEANCGEANFTEADCWDANFTKTKLSYCIGNNREIRSLHLDPYTITIHENIMAIGCEQHTIEDWFGFDDERIGRMDDKALEWWKKYKEFVKMYIDSTKT